MIMLSARERNVFIAEVVCAVIGIGILAWYFSVSEARLTESLKVRIGDQRSVFMARAQETDQNKAAPGAEGIISDCVNRSQFEDMLGRLHLLSRSELMSVSGLFDACGDYFAVRKSLAALALMREHEALMDALTLYRAWSNADSYDAVIPVWDRIVELETTRGALLREQVTLQRDIINALLAGQGGVIGDRLTRAGDINDLLSVHDRQIDDLHKDEERLWSAIR